MMIMMNLEVEEGFYEVAAFPKDYEIKPVMMPNYSITGIAWPGTYNIIITFNEIMITIITTCTQHQASLSLYPPLSPASDQELPPPCLFQFWALFFFPWKYFSIIHYWAPVYKLGSVSYPEILSQFQNSFLYPRRDGAFYSVQSHLNITGLGVPHILHSRATESRVAGFTFRRNAFRIAFELF